MQSPGAPESSQGLTPQASKFSFREMLRSVRKRVAFKKPAPLQAAIETPRIRPVDSDDPEIRAQRVENQHTLENHLEETFELPLVERMRHVRVGLFNGIPDVRGESNVDLREQDLHRSLYLNYASAEMMKNHFLPPFARVINELTEEIKVMGGVDREEAAVRLGSVIYTLGIPLHPYADGNGQTLRMLALSYLHELAPDRFGNSFFPFKPTNNGDNEQGNLQTGFMRAIYNMDSSFMFSGDEKKKSFALKGSIIDKEKDYARDITPEEFSEMFPDEQSREEIMSIFEDARAYFSSMPPQIVGSHPSQANFHYFLGYFLNTDRGHAFIRDYVTDPDVLEGTTYNNTPWYEKNAENYFSGITTDIKGLLESREVHGASFETAKNEALNSQIPKAGTSRY